MKDVQIEIVDVSAQPIENSAWVASVTFNVSYDLGQRVSMRIPIRGYGSFVDEAIDRAKANLHALFAEGANIAAKWAK